MSRNIHMHTTYLHPKRMI